MLNFVVYEDTGKPWSFFVAAARDVFRPIIAAEFPEFLEEMDGIAEGLADAGVDTSTDEVIAWNNMISLLDCWYPNSTVGSTAGPGPGREGGGQQDRCSAFIANGDYTTDGKIVVAHNSFCNYVDGQYYDVILDITPPKGSGARILMQTAACCIWSGTDFFVTSYGIVGTETTIGGFLPYETKAPISCRIRQAMQYGKTLDDYVDVLLKNNSGDYANSWLLGDLATNEIMCLELGLKYHDVKRTKNGAFYGCNVAFSPEIRNLECGNTGYCDTRRHQGARQVRIPQLLAEFKGRIDIEVAKRIIADHHDVYLDRPENPCSRTICSHYDLDKREYMSDSARPKPNAPRGAVDGIVADAALLGKMGFSAKYGSSCPIPFVVADFCQASPQWAHLGPYLRDRPVEPWTEFFALGRNRLSEKTHHHRRRHVNHNKTRHRKQFPN